MNKLNNKGFGLSTLITFIVIFMLFIIVVSILSYKMGLGKGTDSPIYEVETNFDE